MTCLTRPTPVSLLSCRLPYSIQSGFYIKKYEITLLKSNPQKICHSYRLIFAPFAVQFYSQGASNKKDEYNYSKDSERLKIVTYSGNAKIEVAHFNFEIVFNNILDM
mgnify:CR=1 FL=1